MRVHVPATSANLGPGFDALGMALDIGLEVETQLAAIDSFEGRGEAAEIKTPRDNLFFAAADALCAELGVPRPPLAVVCNSRIPLARGLGSSAAAVCAGLLTAAALVPEPPGRDRLLAVAARLEGHPDNVAPALLGGVTVAVREEEGIAVCQVPLGGDIETRLGLVLAVPEFRLSTREARAALPDQVPHRDAAFNAGRAALLVAALSSGRLDLLEAALRDRLHEPHRRSLVPQMSEVRAAARSAGAMAVTLSGAGSALLAWCARDLATAVADAMLRTWGPRTIVHAVEISSVGAWVE